MSSPLFASKLSHMLTGNAKLLYTHLRRYSPSSRVREAERALGYSFVNTRLLEEAITHPSLSTAGAISYERLEVFGDAVLYLALTKHFYLFHPQLLPGQLSRLRSANLCNENLARVAVRHGLYRLVLHNCLGLDKQVAEFTKAVMQGPEEDQIHNGRTQKAPKVLADVVEAIAGAVYEDCNFDLDVMWKVFRRHLEPLITADTLNKKPVINFDKQYQQSGKTVDSRTG